MYLTLSLYLSLYLSLSSLTHSYKTLLTLTHSFFLSPIFFLFKSNCFSSLKVLQIFWACKMRLVLSFHHESRCQFHQHFTRAFFVQIFCQSQNVTRKSCQNDVRTKNLYVKMLMKLTTEGSAKTGLSSSVKLWMKNCYLLSHHSINLKRHEG